MARKRRSKTLERAARSVHDSDEFVEHVFGIARGFADHYALDAGAGARGVRQALKNVGRHAAALRAWLEGAEVRGSAEYEALGGISRTLSSPGQFLSDSTVVRRWMELTIDASEAATEMMQGQKLQNAPRFAAQALRATFEHHKLAFSHRVTAKKRSDAVTVLCAIAKDAGDPSMTADEASQWLAGTVR